MPTPEIRKETAADCDVIRCVTELAFRDMPFSDGDEQSLIDELRIVGALTLSLVAVVQGEIIGHIAFSPAHASDESSPWFALGPVSVTPELQRQSIGSALIENGLSQIQDMDALGCILTGNPQYYKRFGFKPSPENVPPNEPAEFFMLKLFSSAHPRGPIHFHEVFYGDA